MRNLPLSSLATVALSCLAVAGSLGAQGLLWTQMLPSRSPSARGWHAMAYDGARQNVVMFGGYNGAEPSDTWTWNGLDWTPQTQATLQGRRWHCMVYDEARQLVVLYGGSMAGSYPTTTHLWNGVIWSAVTTPVHPGRRAKHGMAYDRARQRVVLYGGAIPANTETWEWDGSAWSIQNPAVNPDVRNEHAMVYDAARQRTVLFGGQFGPAQSFAYANDTWTWNGSVWQQELPAASPPVPRLPAQGMAYDASRQQVVLFSGSSLRADTWVWDGSNWTQLATSPTPVARSAHSLVYDEARQTLVMFGGSIGGYAGDTWVTRLLATAVAYGAGCGSPALDLQPDPTGRPVLGQNAKLLVHNVPGLLALAAGWSRTWFGLSPLPMSLAGFGMPGCDLLQSAEFMGLAATPVSATTSATNYPLPNLPVMLGRSMFLQAYAVAPGQNSLQLIVSNGVEWVFGAQ